MRCIISPPFGHVCERPSPVRPTEQEAPACVSEWRVQEQEGEESAAALAGVEQDLSAALQALAALEERQVAEVRELVALKKALGDQVDRQTRALADLSNEVLNKCMPTHPHPRRPALMACRTLMMQVRRREARRDQHVRDLAADGVQLQQVLARRRAALSQADLTGQQRVGPGLGEAGEDESATDKMAGQVAPGENEDGAGEVEGYVLDKAEEIQQVLRALRGLDEAKQVRRRALPVA